MTDFSSLSICPLENGRVGGPLEGGHSEKTGVEVQPQTLFLFIFDWQGVSLSLSLEMARCF